jgi:tRNA A-37 threonylcarbamoyl transferase component Bud32/outer membrane protein assembly factor BamB
MPPHPPSDALPRSGSPDPGDRARRAAEPDALVGRFLGPYHVLRFINSGGMGAVYLAEHPQLDRKVAVKVLPADRARDPAARERFHREARAAAALDHPHIVRVFDMGTSEGTPYLVMEYIDGEDLQSRLDRDGPLPYRDAVAQVAQAAAGLQHAHERGFVHRDVKPGNLICGRDGTVKVLDMGLARPFRDTPARDRVTETVPGAELAGTVDFVSPEQALNSPLDARTDIYSLGATLFTLVTGGPPYEGETYQKLAQAQFGEPPRLLDVMGDAVPAGLSALVARMMAKCPEDRPQTANEVIAALAPWLPAGALEALVPDATVRAALRPPRLSRRAVLFGLGAAAAGAAVAAPFAFRAARREPVPPHLLLTGHDAKPNDLIFSPGGDRLLSADTEGQLVIWDARTGAALHKPEPRPNARFWGCGPGPNGTALAGGSGQPVLAIDWRTGKLVREYAAHAPAVTGLATAADDSRVFVSGNDADVVARDATTGEEVLRLRTGATMVWSLAVSPDGTQLAAGTGDGSERCAVRGRFRAIVWRASDGKELHRLAGHTGAVRAVAFSPDGRTLATGGFDGTVRVWNLDTGTQVLKIDAHDGYAERAFYLPDGKRIISCGGPSDVQNAGGGAGEGGAVKVWDAATGAELRAWRGPEWHDLVALAVSPDGRTVATGARDNLVRLWPNLLDS